ncbi:MAG: hypothetical protein U1E67_21030 [Hyphomicrobiales bacterium]
MNTQPRKSRLLTKDEFGQLLASGEWQLDTAASERFGRPLYVGPDDQMIATGFAKSERPRLSNGRTEFFDRLFNPPRTVTVVGGFHLKPETFLAFVPEEAAVDAELDTDPNHSMADYPARDIEPDGTRFIELLTMIGNRMIEFDSSLHWRIKTSAGIMTRIDIVSESESIPIDAVFYKQVWDRRPNSHNRKVDVEHYARSYLKCHRETR